MSVSSWRPGTGRWRHRLRRAVRVSLVGLGLLMPLNLPFAVPTGHDITLGWSGAAASRGPGVLVTQTTWVANAAGLTAGDRVLSVGAEPATPELLDRLRSSVRVGEQLQLNVLRRGEELTLAVPVVASPPTYSAYLWYRFLLAMAAWLVGMALIIWRGHFVDALVLGAAMLFIAPVTLAVEIPGGGWLLGLANTLWQLQGGAYRFFFPVLLLHFVALHAGAASRLRSGWLWGGVYLTLLASVALVTDAFRDPLAWRRPGAEQEIRAAAGLFYELLAVAGSVFLLRRIRGSMNALRWLILTVLFFLLAGIPSSVAVLTPAAPPEAREFLRQLKALLLLLVVGTALLYVFTLERREAGEWQLRGRLASSASVLLTGLFGFAVAGAAAIVHSLEARLGDVESLLFITIFLAAIFFSPVLRWAREMVDRQMFARWTELEVRARGFADRIAAHLEPERIADDVHRELPQLLEVTDVRLVLTRELLDDWGLAGAGPLEAAEEAVLLRKAAHGREKATTYMPVRRTTGALFGVLCVGERLDRRVLEPPEHAVLRAIAQGVAAALRNAEAYLKLRAAQRELDSAERVASMGALAGGLAHEIKNPLASLKMGLYLLTQDGRDADKLNRIRRDVQRIDDLVSGLLRFTHSNDVEAKEAVDVNELVRGCVDDVRQRAGDRDTQLQASYPSTPVHALAGPNQLRLVVSNLLVNALEAVGSGGEIEVRVSAGADEIEIAVQDSGPGIPSEQRERIFDLSFSTKPTGTGLGLALARRETERLGGTIHVDSAARSGTRLRVALPRITIAEPKPRLRTIPT